MQDKQYVVVKNHDNQYSIWAVGSTVPAGWNVQPMQGSKEACLDYIRTHWTDMRPVSLRNSLSADAARQ